LVELLLIKKSRDVPLACARKFPIGSREGMWEPADDYLRMTMDFVSWYCGVRSV
jgi:hypothetical protein